MTFFLFIVVGYLLYIAYITFSGSHGEQSEPESYSKPVGLKPFYNQTLQGVMVQGIFAEKSRIRAFNGMAVGEEVKLAFEPDNPYDRNAIAVLTFSDEMLGYLPKNQRKLIKTLKSNPEYHAEVSYKNDYYDDGSDKHYYKLGLTLYVGFDKEALYDLIEEKSRKKELIEEKKRFKSILAGMRKKLAALKAEDLDRLHKNLEQLTDDIVQHNREAYIGHDDLIVRPPLLELLDVVKMKGELNLVMKYFELYGNEKFYTDAQMKKILNIVERAQKDSIISDSDI